MPRFMLEGPWLCKIFCFCTYTLCMNYSTKTFLLDSSLVSIRQLFCFVHGQGQKSKQKPTTKNFVKFHSHSPLVTMLNVLFTFYGYYKLTTWATPSWLDSSQLVEHSIGIAEVMGSNLVHTWIFFQALISQLLISCVHNCDDQSYLHIILRSSNVWTFIYSLVSCVSWWFDLVPSL